MNATYEQVGRGIFAIDTEYVRPRMDASHLVVADGHAAFIDVGTYFSIPNLLATLTAQGLAPEAVDYVFLTHIHLDHAGGAGRLLAALPRAQVLVHPRGASHLIDPTILVAATEAVYGAARFAQEYGKIQAIPADRVEALADGQRVPLGGRTWEVLFTPGHALHHVSIVDRESGDIFTGDTFGVSYRELDTAAGAFIFPSTTPSQFDPQQLHASIERIVECRPSSVYLTHYSRVDDVARLSADLHADIDAFVHIARSVADHPDRTERVKSLMFEHLSTRLDRHGYTGDDASRHAVLDGDIDLNCVGLSAWLSRRSS